jgi:hypothetical protein
MELDDTTQRIGFTSSSWKAETTQQFVKAWVGVQTVQQRICLQQQEIPFLIGSIQPFECPVLIAKSRIDKCYLVGCAIAIGR